MAPTKALSSLQQNVSLLIKTVTFLWRARPGLAAAVCLSSAAAGILPVLAVAASRDLLNRLAAATQIGADTWEMLTPVLLIGGLYVLALLAAEASATVAQVTGGLYMDYLIAEHGTHAELMRHGGQYARLYTAQAAMYTMPSEI